MSDSKLRQLNEPSVNCGVYLQVQQPRLQLEGSHPPALHPVTTGSQATLNSLQESITRDDPAHNSLSL